jgi:hypothetical protein
MQLSHLMSDKDAMATARDMRQSCETGFLAGCAILLQMKSSPELNF